MYEGSDRDKCPMCGCEQVKITHHREVTYPEEYTEYNCKKCGHLVGVVDNSPYVSCYDFHDFVIEI